MLNNKFEELKEWFDLYVTKFKFEDREDQKQIDLKYYHSLRVLEEITELANDLNLTQKEQFTAKIIGLFHDVGRFEQYSLYRTFSDARSTDHARLGVKILVKNNLLSWLDRSTRKIIYKAIIFHNKIAIPENAFSENSTGLRFARMIRDADKLDIWKLFINRYYSNNNNDRIYHGLAIKPGITPEIYEKMSRGEVVNYQKLKTEDDLKLMQMGWVYDLNFRESLRKVKKRGYIEKIYKSMSPSREAKLIYNEIMKYLENKTTSMNNS